MTRALHTVLCMTYTDIIIIFRVFPIYYRPSSVCKSSASLSFFLSLAFSFTRTSCIISHTRAYAKRLKEERLFYTLIQFSNYHIGYLGNGLAVYPNGQTVDSLRLAVTGASGSEGPPLGGVQQRCAHHSQTLIPPGQTQLRSARGAEETHTKWHQWLRLCSLRLLR